MADCNKTLDYMKERDRYCDSIGGTCYHCKMNINMNTCANPTQEHIIILQSWSNSHPVKTRQSNFLKMFPNAEYDDYGILIEPCTIDTSLYKNETRCEEKCCDCRKKYWSEELE